MRSIRATNKDLNYLANAAGPKSKADSTKGLDGIPEPLPKSGYFMIISGRPGSGKTSFLAKLLYGRENHCSKKYILF